MPVVVADCAFGFGGLSGVKVMFIGILEEWEGLGRAVKSGAERDNEGMGVTIAV